MIKRIISLFLCFGLLFQQTGFAQVAATELNLASYFAKMSGSFIQDKFRPLHLRYFSYDSLSNNFKLLLDKGDFNQGLSPFVSTQGLKGADPEAMLKQSTKELLNYFLIGVTLPNEAFWVNLRPDSENKIIDDELAKTDIGKLMLEADLELKKDTARYTSPQTPEGREYWDKLYKKAEELYGSENITIPTLTRPWIVPNEIIVRETKDSAYVYKASLKVMLEEDYLNKSEIRNPKSETNPKSQISNYKQYEFNDPRLKELNAYSSQLIRELIIPKLTQEVNISKRYAPLRQVYYSLILSRWFKSRFYGKAGAYASLIDKSDLTGLTSKENWSKATYFNAYQKSFAQGEYNIKEPVYTPTSAVGGSAFGGGQVIRSYFSGGVAFNNGMIPDTRTSAASSIGIGAFRVDGSDNFLPTIAHKTGMQLFEGNAVSSQISAASLIKENKAKPSASSPLESPIPNRGIRAVFDALPSRIRLIRKGWIKTEGHVFRYIDHPSQKVQMSLSKDYNDWSIRLDDMGDKRFISFNWWGFGRLHFKTREGEKWLSFFADPFVTLLWDTAGDVETVTIVFTDAAIDAFHELGLRDIDVSDGKLRRRIISESQLKIEQASLTKETTSSPVASSFEENRSHLPLTAYRSPLTAESSVHGKRYTVNGNEASSPVVVEIVKEKWEKVELNDFQKGEIRRALINVLQSQTHVNAGLYFTIDLRRVARLNIHGAINDLIEGGYPTKIVEAILWLRDETPYTDKIVLAKIAIKVTHNVSFESNDQKTIPTNSGQSSSPLGGIDFRALPMTLQPMGSFSALNFNLPTLSKAELERMDLDEEMRAIQNMVKAGIIPSGQRIKEFVAACAQKGAIRNRVDDLILCLVDIFKLEEERASESAPELKEALVIVDAI